MTDVVLEGISEVLTLHKDLLRIVLRQKAKFEGWLKFELACYLEKTGMENVEVETKLEMRRDFADISFVNRDDFYRIELKTCNTNWNGSGIRSGGKPITKNIQSVIKDIIKLDSNYGIVAFVLFPIPVSDKRWHAYIDRIVKVTGIAICKEANCKLIEMPVSDCDTCEMLICTFASKLPQPIPWYPRKWR